MAKSIKMAGLALVMDASEEDNNGEGIAASHGAPDGVDGILRSNGILRFNEVVEM